MGTISPRLLLSWCLLHTTAWSQTSCPAGNVITTNSAGQESCQQCSIGRYKTQAMASCRECPSGYYQGSAGQSSCRLKSCDNAQVSHSNFQAEGSLTGQTDGEAVVVCSEGYEGGGTFTCIGTIGTKSQQFVGTKCTAAVCTPTQVLNSLTEDPNSINGVETGSKFEIVCKPKFVGGGTSQCLLNGSMSFVPACVPYTPTNKVSQAKGGAGVDSSDDDGEYLSPSSLEEVQAGSRFSSHWVVLGGLVIVIVILVGAAVLVIFVVHKFNGLQKSSEDQVEDQIELGVKEFERQQRQQQHPNQVVPLIQKSGWGGKRTAKKVRQPKRQGSSRTERASAPIPRPPPASEQLKRHSSFDDPTFTNVPPIDMYDSHDNRPVRLGSKVVARVKL